MSQGEPGIELDTSLGYMLKAAASALHAALEAVLRPLGMTITHYACLELLAQRPGLVLSLHVARKVADGRFTIAGGRSGLDVSWQVTGVRKDVWAQANPIEVEKEKSPDEQGFYLYPELYGEPEEKNIGWAQHPDIMRQLQEQ